MNLQTLILLVGKILAIGELRVASINGWCNVSVDNVSYGVTPVARIMLTEGYHQVRCTTLDGKDSEVFPIKVTANKIQRMKFVILTYTWQDMTGRYEYFED